MLRSRVRSFLTFPRSFSWARLAILAGAVYLGFGAVLFFFQSSFLYFPQAGEQSLCPLVYKLGITREMIESTEIFFKSNGPVLVVFYQGNAGTRCDRLFLMEFFDRLGLSYAFVGYSGYGDGDRASAKRHHADVRAVDTWLGGKNFEDIVYMGESLGTGLAAHHATLRSPAGLILVSPYPTLADVARAHYPLYPPFLLRERYETLPGVRAYTGPLLIIHGERDAIISTSLGREVFTEATSREKDFFLVPGVGHNDLFDRTEVYTTLEDFFRTIEGKNDPLR